METIKKSIADPQIVASVENHIWVTSYGKRIPVRQMTTDHIQKCIDCWNGIGDMHISHDYLGGKDKWLSIFNAELVSRS